MAKSGGQKRRREAENAQEQRSTENGAPAGPPAKKTKVGDSTSLFVRSLPPTATGETLTEFFSEHYPVKHAMVVLDPQTKVSRGFGFVTFTDAEDALEAKAKLNNELLGGRRLKLEIAESRHRSSADHSGAASKLADEKRKRDQDLVEARKAPKLIVRNLPWSVKTSEDLAVLFRSFGKVKFADLPQSKGKLSGFGFVTLRGRKNAEKAMEAVNGKLVDGRTLAVDWAVDKKTWEQQKNESEDEDENDGGETNKPKKEKKAAKEAEEDEEKDEDEDVDEAEADLRNFMKNHMENLEEESDDDKDKDGDKDEESDADSEEDEEAEDDDDDETAKAPAKKNLGSDNSSTLFVRNLPFTATDQTLKEHFSRFGDVRYARIVVDRATDRPAGTGFVCFFKADDMMACLKGAPRRQPVANAMTTKNSVLQDETVDPEGKYTMEGRVLQVSQAVSKDEASRLTTTGASSRKDKDKRRLYLLSEGTINSNTPLYKMLTPSEIKMREASAAQRKKLIRGNPALHLSLTRLAIRNIPRNIGSKELKALAREAVVGFAKDVKEDRRLPLSKEEVMRGGQLDKEAEHRRREKGKGVVGQAKVVFETQKGSKVDEKSGGKSRGYGFVEYSSHRWALMGLRWLNGHALQDDAGKTSRLVVEFAIENANVVARRRFKVENLRSREAAAATEGHDDGDDGGFEDESDMDSPAKKGGKGRAGKGTGGKKGAAADGAIEPKDKAARRAEKLALRQQIIGRKRMMRKKKAEARKH